MIVWRWIVDALAVYRLTRLVTADGITEDFRARIDSWAHTADAPAWRDKAAELVECRWCTSMWWALGLVLIVRRTSWWPTIADALALSAVSTLVAGLETD